MEIEIEVKAAIDKVPTCVLLDEEYDENIDYLGRPTSNGGRVRAVGNPMDGIAKFDSDGSITLTFKEEHKQNFDVYISPEDEAGKQRVMIFYSDWNTCFSASFYAGEECLFCLKKGLFREDIHTGYFKTLKVENTVTRHGGRLIVKFKACYRGTLTSRSAFEFEVYPKGEFLLS